LSRPFAYYRGIDLPRFDLAGLLLVWFSYNMKTPDLVRILRGRYTLTAVNAAVGLALLLAVLLLARDVASLALSPGGKVRKQTVANAGAPKYILQDYKGILKDNPFGFPGGDLVLLTPASGRPVAHPDVFLIGTVAGRKNISYAIFADSKGEQEVFRVGQEVYGLGKLERVEKTRVFLRLKGVEREIPFADLVSVKEVKPGGVVPLSSFSRQTGESTYAIDAQKIQQAIENPAQLMTDARFVPNIEQGAQRGFILREVKPGGIYQNLGLRSGDVLLKINEYSISNPEAALQALTALRGIDRAQLDIVRNGSNMTMTYQIR